MVKTLPPRAGRALSPPPPRSSRLPPTSTVYKKSSWVKVHRHIHYVNGIGKGVKVGVWVRKEEVRREEELCYPLLPKATPSSDKKVKGKKEKVGKKKDTTPAVKKA
ncbi:hypothetical protein TrLO_g4678 [Triparma laevis f. longispina]|uniref:Uncharacterized protein n=1 Tax=Triparma laevis f. longispina TaxID=1714387 RepID=A0A9W7DP92_9STRA|nr:hypothetical protein TrLO_g4678 [Triparma laevis f. longispina]